MTLLTMSCQILVGGVESRQLTRDLSHDSVPVKLNLVKLAPPGPSDRSSPRPTIVYLSKMNELHHSGSGESSHHIWETLPMLTSFTSKHPYG